ncbi:hypothetical protein Bca52824_093324 [Brassica carinata]|uniref:Nucleolar pre-ribosomal-associated protein 1 n=1 Tax=Brassica carinata TaxID=52824 RepID=A0A8X7P5X4_BRACI|nr:hypothetical protein Bca52824_093324 [Brassica carinata]
MVESKSDIEEEQGMVVNGGGNSNLEVVMAFGPSHEAKLRELLHKLCSEEIKLCSDASKEFVKLLKGETGGDLLRLYFQKSPEFAELLEAWRIRHGKQGLHYIFSLIQTVLSHPEGKGRSTDIGTALDRFCLLLIQDKMDEICKGLNSKESKQQNAALGLLTSMVRRGSRLASEIAGKFDFKGFAKLAEYKTRGGGVNATRRACVVFAVSFLEVGKPRLLSDVLQKKEMYSKVLRGLGKDDDDDDTVAYALSTLSNKILVEESMVLPSLRSVLFGIATLEQLASISAREDGGGIVNELAHDVLVKVCTDPCNGLMPDETRKLTGNLERLLMFMKKLRATEIVYHRDLLLAIVKGRPSLASAFFEEFPYIVENFASPSWVSSISLAADLVSSVRSSCSFEFLNPDQRSTPPSGGSEVQTIMKEVQTIMKCICPRPFSRLLITRGMLCPKFFVKHGTLRFLSETVLLWDSLVTAAHSCSEQIQASLERDVMGEVRSFFPDSQVLLTELKSQSDASGIQKPSSKRKAVLNSGVVGREKRIKRSEKDVLDEVAGDIVIGGVGLAEDPVDAHMTDGNEYLQNVSEIWASERCSKPVDSVEEAEMYLRIKIMDVLRIYVRTVPNVLEGSFDVFMKFLPSQRSSWLPAELQRAVLSFLNEYISWTPRSQSESIRTRMPPHMYMQLDVFVNLFLFSSDDEVKDLAYNLALVAMSSTGAFDKNPSEIGAWFRFLQGCGKTKGPLKVQEAVQSTSAVVISFLYDAVRTVGKNMFKYWDIIRSSLSHLKGVSIGFSPLIVCVLQKCVKLLTVSKSLTFPEKSAISLYVCTTLKYLLQTQVDSRPLSCLVESVLSEVVDESKDSLCEWWPLRALLAIAFLEENFLGDLSKLSPDLLVRGSELSGSRSLREGTQPAAKRRIYDVLWELEEKNYDSNLLEEVYSLACSWEWHFQGKHNLRSSSHLLTVIISQIVGRTPEDLIIHCINQASMTRAKILFYLVESSPLHRKQQGDSALTDDQLIMLLPAVLSYLSPVFAKPEKPCSRCLDITSVYSNILRNGFLQWPKFSSGCIFEEKYEEILLSANEDIDTMFKASLLGKAVRMFQEHLAWTESPTKTEDLLKVFQSMFPHTSAGKEMLDCEIKEVDVQSVDCMFNVAIREVAKVELSRICLFPADSNFKRQAASCVKENPSEMGSNKESLFTALLDYLVDRWQCVVKRFDGSFKGKSEEKQDKCGLLCKILEDMCEELVHLDSLPFLEGLMKSVLLYRFEDSMTLKILREIFCVLSRGKYSYASYIQLLISHSQFTPTISSLSSSHTGDLFRPISSILKHLIIPSPSSVGVGSCRLQAPDYVKQLEIVKILRVLLSKCGKDSGIILKELHFLLLCSYGATLREIDIELYRLIRDIELIDEEHTLDVSETGYLWGKAALKMREGLRLSQDASDGGEDDLVEDLRQRLFKENLCVDPKICALTVLYFSYQRSAEVSDNSYLSDDPISEDIERYDPAFILRFSLHSLTVGYIEPLEFASLGLLAVAFVSMSSADLGMRKLAYDTLMMFLDVLESGTRNKQVKWIKLLLLCLKNGVEEPWQRIPTVSAVFAAEASLILLNSSHEHYVPIRKLLKSSLSLNLRGIPLFHEFLWSRYDEFFSTPLADDETKGLILQVVRKSAKFNKMARHLVQDCGLFSWCSSLISMFNTKPIRGEDFRLVVVLEVITDVLASRSVTEWLQEEEIRGPCGECGDPKKRIAFPLEGLMEVSSRLCRLLGGGLVSIQENSTLVDFILQILFATLKISQKLRNMYQPHFTITIVGILQLFEAVANCDSPEVEASAERGLDTILMSTPPFELICMDADKLRRFLLWGTSTALKSDLKKGSKPSESHQDTKTLTEEPQEETMVAKFLRWLLASVILGKLYSKANDSEPAVLSKTTPESLLTLLEYFKTMNLEGSETKSEHIIGEVIVYLQQLSSTNYSVLPLLFVHFLPCFFVMASKLQVQSLMAITSSSNLCVLE